jgi:hypothetical protein
MAATSSSSQLAIGAVLEQVPKSFAPASVDHFGWTLQYLYNLSQALPSTNATEKAQAEYIYLSLMGIYNWLKTADLRHLRQQLLLSLEKQAMENTVNVPAAYATAAILLFLQDRVNSIMNQGIGQLALTVMPLTATAHPAQAQAPQPQPQRALQSVSPSPTLADGFLFVPRSPQRRRSRGSGSGGASSGGYAYAYRHGYE